MKKYQLLGTKILVRRASKVTKTNKGIYLPENHQRAPSEGIVLEVGPGKLLDNGNIVPLTVKVGQKVVFNEYSGTLLPESGDPKAKEAKDELVVLNDEDEVLAIIKEE